MPIFDLAELPEGLTNTPPPKPYDDTDLQACRANIIATIPVVRFVVRPTSPTNLACK
jgi:hypothetical protein